MRKKLISLFILGGIFSYIFLNLMFGISPRVIIKRDSLFEVDNFHTNKDNTFCAPEIKVLILISSAPSNFEKRKIIRNTWGNLKSYSDVALYFLLGLSNFSLTYEIDKYNDIVMGSFIDTYNNLTYKHVMGLIWSLHNCHHAKVIAKVDDDVFLNVTMLRDYEITDNKIHCLINKHMPVLRTSCSKWCVTFEQYPFKEYPTYCAGFFILYTNKIIDTLLHNIVFNNYFYIDDVYVTGLLAKDGHVKHYDLGHYYLNPKTFLTQNFSGILFGPLNASPEVIANISRTNGD